MDGVNRSSRKSITVSHASSVDHKRVQKSATLNRKFVKKPVGSPKVSNVSVKRKISVANGRADVVANRAGGRILTKTNSVRLQPVAVKNVATTAQVKTQAKSGTAGVVSRIVDKRKTGGIAQKEVLVQPEVAKVARARMMAREAEAPKEMTAREIKDRAIQQALKKMSKVEAGADFDEVQPQKRHFWQKKSFAVATAMSLVLIALLGYITYLNLPDLSARVAAMQSGIEKVYPGFVPNSYRLDGLVKEDAGRITMAFRNDEGKSFTLREEKSSWDSNAVLTNYVKKEWDDYSITKGQGLTIYVSGSNAAWVNGGVFYVINDLNGDLSGEDLHDIAVSL